MADLPLDEASVEVVGRYDMVTERCLCRDFNHETVEDEASKRPQGGGGLGMIGRLCYVKVFGLQKPVRRKVWKAFS